MLIVSFAIRHSVARIG